MTKQFITSDIHLFHGNIMKFCPQSRGHFKDVSDMNETIIRDWNKTVSFDDEVFILGDVSFGRADDTVKIMKRLNGRKFLIIGNHDHKMLKDPAFRNCFEWSRDYAKISVDGTSVVLFHYPVADWDGMHRGNVHFHGHLHGTPHGVTGRIKDVGMDTNSCQVYELANLVKSMLKYEVRKHHEKVE